MASYLVGLLCGAVKCRAADDLFGVCQGHPRFEAARLDLTFRPERGRPLAIKLDLEGDLMIEMPSR